MVVSHVDRAEAGEKIEVLAAFIVPDSDVASPVEEPAIAQDTKQLDEGRVHMPGIAFDHS